MRRNPTRTITFDGRDWIVAGPGCLPYSFPTYTAAWRFCARHNYITTPATRVAGPNQKDRT